MNAILWKYRGHELQRNLRMTGSHASDNGPEGDIVQKVELGDHPNDYLRMSLDYDPRFINRNKRPKNQLILDANANE